MKRQTKKELFDLLLKSELGKGIPEPVKEFRFHPVRKWRADYAWEASKIIVECEGGNWTGGRHVRGKGYENDCEKYNAAILLGWRVLRFTVSQLKREPVKCFETLRECLGIE